MTRIPRHRVVITGLGVLSPLGLTMEETWDGLIAGKNGVGPITLFDASRCATRIAGAASRLGVPLLDRVVRENDKQRFAISSDGTRIRANQGHSIEIDLELHPAQPPELLYHGTVARFMDSIRASGLDRGSRQYVHLSPDVETARKVGRRRGRPIVLIVEAGRMFHDDYAFFRSENGVWLTDSVPTHYLRIPDE